MEKVQTTPVVISLNGDSVLGSCNFGRRLMDGMMNKIHHDQKVIAHLHQCPSLIYLLDNLQNQQEDNKAMDGGDEQLYLNAVKRMKQVVILPQFCSSRRIMKELCRKSFVHVEKASDELKKDREFVKEILQIDGRAIKYFGEDFQNDLELVELAHKHGGFPCLLEKYRSDLKMVMKSMEIIPEITCSFMDYKFRESKEVMMKALNYSWKTFNYSGDELRKDKEYVTKAIQSNPKLFRDCYEFREDRDVSIKAIELDPLNLEYTSITLRHDRKLQEMALEKNVLALKYCDIPYGNFSSKKKDNKNVKKTVAPKPFRLVLEWAMKAVKADGEILSYLESFNSNRDLVMEAVKSNPKSIIHAHYKLQEDVEIIKTAILHGHYSLIAAHSELMNDPEVSKVILENYHLSYYHVPEKLKQDKDFVLKVVTKFSKGLLIVNDEFKKDKDVVMAAIKHNPKAIAFAHESIQHDREVILTALELSPSAFLCIPESEQRDREFIQTQMYYHDSDVFFSNGIVKEEHRELFSDTKFLNECLQFLSLKHI